MKNITIEKGKEFAAFLARIFLEGLIQECVLSFKKDGSVTCQAVDLSNTVCSSQSAEIGCDSDIDIGVGNLSTLCKYFASSGTFKIAVSDLKMTVKKKGHGQVTFQLVEPSEIGTAIKEVNMEEKCSSKESIVLKGSKVDDLMYHFGLLGCESVVFHTSKGSLFAESPSTDTEQFKLKIGKCKKDIRVVSYVKHISTILKKTNTDTPLRLYIENESAIAIEQNGQYWLILPIEE